MRIKSTLFQELIETIQHENDSADTYVTIGKDEMEFSIDLKNIKFIDSQDKTKLSIRNGVEDVSCYNMMFVMPENVDMSFDVEDLVFIIKVGKDQLEIRFDINTDWEAGLC